MTNRPLITLLALSLFACVTIQATKSNMNFGAILPGMGGGGEDKTASFYLTAGLHPKLMPNNIKEMKRPLEQFEMDFGQQQCINIFSGESEYTAERFAPRNPWYSLKELSSHNDVKNNTGVFSGISQGTATLVNWLGQMDHAQQEKQVAGLFLESVLGSGNSAILHTLENVSHMMELPEDTIGRTIFKGISTGISALTYLPFARTWIPSAARIAFPLYKPSGIQPIDSAAKISPNIPVIIMHHKEDKQLSIDDARRLYCALRKAGHDKVYLFEIEGEFRLPRGYKTVEEYHANLIDKRITIEELWAQHCIDPVKHIKIIDFALDEEKEIIENAVQTIYAINNIQLKEQKYKEQDIDLSPYQPSVEEVEARIAQNSRKKNIVRNLIDCSAGIALAAGVYHLASHYLQRATV